MSKKSVLITGGGGYLGKQIVKALAQQKNMNTGEISCVVSSDVREAPASERLAGVDYVTFDIRQNGLDGILKSNAVDTVVHLASIVTPGKKSNRAFEYSVDVEGTQKVLDACVAAGVKHIIVSSSGASYGYHADNADWLSEDHPIRGNQEFAYSWHKRLVEEMLKEYRLKHVELKQTIFRIGTILGDTVKNQITDLFERPRLIAIRGSDSPFVFIWDQDVVEAFLTAIRTGKSGIFNVAGDGAMTIHEIASRLGKSVVNVPACVLQSSLWILKKVGLTQYGPEQINFLRYRPVLDNKKLKEEFGFRPGKTSSEVFDYWMHAREKNKGGNS